MTVYSINGIPQAFTYSPRKIYASLALVSLIEYIKAVVKSIFTITLSILCLGFFTRMNREAVYEIKTMFAYGFFFPVCLLGIAAPEALENLVL